MNAETDTAVTLANDLKCILLECHRDRPDLFPHNADKAALAALAHRISARLGPIIGSSYVGKEYALGLKAKKDRDAQVVQARKDGLSETQLVRKFKISRRLVYSILAQRPKR